MIADAEREAGEIGRALRRAQGIVARGPEQQQHDVNQRYEALCKRRDALRIEMSTMRLTDGAIQSALEFAQDILAGTEKADIATKRRNLELLQITVEVRGRNFEVKGPAGEWSGEIRELPKVQIEENLSLAVTITRPQAPIRYRC